MSSSFCRILGDFLSGRLPSSRDGDWLSKPLQNLYYFKQFVDHSSLLSRHFTGNQ